MLWQNLLVFGIVVGAAAYVARRVWRWATSKKATGCWSCSGCPKLRRSARLISLDPPRRPPEP